MLKTLTITLGVFSVLGLLNAVIWLGTGYTVITLMSIAIFGSCGFLCIHLDSIRQQIEEPSK